MRSGMMMVSVLALSACGWRAQRVERMVQLRAEDALDALDATPVQRRRVRQSMRELVNAAGPLVKQAQGDGQVLLGEWRSTSADPAKVHAVVDAELELLRTLAHQGADAALELRALLTPEQRDRVAHQIERLFER